MPVPCRSSPRQQRYRGELDVGGGFAGGFSSARQPLARLGHLRRGAGLRRAQPHRERFFQWKVQIQGVSVGTKPERKLLVRFNVICFRAGAREEGKKTQDIDML